jgi:hypothetical protein
MPRCDATFLPRLAAGIEEGWGGRRGAGANVLRTDIAVSKLYSWHNRVFSTPRARRGHGSAHSVFLVEDAEEGSDGNPAARRAARRQRQSCFAGSAEADPSLGEETAAAGRGRAGHIRGRLCQLFGHLPCFLPFTPRRLASSHWSPCVFVLVRFPRSGPAGAGSPR